MLRNFLTDKKDVDWLERCRMVKGVPLTLGCSSHSLVNKGRIKAACWRSDWSVLFAIDRAGFNSLVWSIFTDLLGAQHRSNVEDKVSNRMRMFIFLKNAQGFNGLDTQPLLAPKQLQSTSNIRDSDIRDFRL